MLNLLGRYIIVARLGWDRANMEFRFDCECGSEMSDFTRGRSERTVQVTCDDCEAVYAVTVTQLQAGDRPSGADVGLVR